VLPKPDHLGPEYGEQYRDASVVAAYHHRPPYPEEVLDILDGLIVAPGIVLDAGTGTGEIARGMARRGMTVDAVDPSPGMLARARELPDGDHTNLSWILGHAEDAPLRPEYGLIIAAMSLQWMDWPVVLARFREVLAPDAVLAIVDERSMPNPWDGALQELINRYSTNRGFKPYNLVAELEQRNLFREVGRRKTTRIPFRQSPASYIESFHARNGFSRDRMSAEAAAAFDEATAEVVAPYLVGGEVSLTVGAEVIWGVPAPQ
jgi:SAM-dependent methyltransferase